MKYKIIKLSNVTLLCILCIALVAGSSKNLKIFRNGMILEVPSKLEVSSDANLTLICKVENITNKGLVNGNVTWFILVKLRSEWKLKGFKNESNLVLSNANGNKEGLYVCGHLKFKNFKILHLLMKHNKSAKPNYINVSRLDKRDIVPGYGPHDYNNITNFHEPDSSPQNRVAEIFMEEHFRKIKEHNERKIKFNNNIRNLNSDSDSDSPSFVKPVSAVVGTLIISFIVFFIIRYYREIRRNSLTKRNIRQLNTQHNAAMTSPTVNRYGHTSSATNYLTNPSGACIYRNDTSPSAPMIYHSMDASILLRVEAPHVPHMENITAQSDSPPTYSSLVHNSTQNLTNDTTYGFNKTIENTADSNNFNLPPSYSEAVGYIDHSYNVIANHNHNDHHSSTDGFSGHHSSGGESVGRIRNM